MTEPEPVESEIVVRGERCKVTAASHRGTWRATGTFRRTGVCFCETPFVHTIKLTCTGDRVTYKSEANVGFGPTRPAPLVGVASKK